MFIKAVMDAGSGLPTSRSRASAPCSPWAASTRPRQGHARLNRRHGRLGRPNATVDEVIKPGLFENPYWQLMTIVRGVNRPRSMSPGGARLPPGRSSSPGARPRPTSTLSTTGTPRPCTHWPRSTTWRSSSSVSRQGPPSRMSWASWPTASRSGAPTTSGTGLAHRSPTASSLPSVPHRSARPSPPAIRPQRPTVAGYVAAAIAKAAGALLARRPPSHGCRHVGLGLHRAARDRLRYGGLLHRWASAKVSDSPFAPGTLVSPWGIPVYVDPHMAADDLYVADWKAFKVYVGDDFRVDTSEEAGERWDKNLVGFRGRWTSRSMRDRRSTPGPSKSWPTS